SGLLGRREGRGRYRYRGRTRIDELHRRVGVAAVLVPGAPLGARLEGVILFPVAVRARDEPPIRDEHVIRLAAEAAECSNLGGTVIPIGGEHPNDHATDRRPRVAQGARDGWL